MVELLIVSLTGLCVTQSRMRQSSPERQLLICRVADSHDRGIMVQRSRRIPVSRVRPGKLKEPNRSPNLETDRDPDLNHQGADHVFLYIGPAVPILQLNIEGISAAKREILSTICS